MLTDEMLLANKLVSLGNKGHLFDGLTSFDERRERARTMCKQFADITYAVRDGKRVTMLQQFCKVYGCDP